MHSLGLMLLSFCCSYCVWGCKKPSAEKPVKTFQDSFHRSSAEFYRKLYDEEARYIEAYIRRHTAKEYKKNTSGFWMYRSKNYGVEKKSVRHGDEICFTYSVQDFNGKEIYREDEIGLQKVYLGEAYLVRGIEEALKIIQEGEGCELLLPSFHAYGISGDGNRILSNQPLIIRIKRLKNPKND